MWFRKKEDVQRLNLEPPSPTPPASMAAPTGDIEAAQVQAILSRAKQILDSGKTPEHVYVCGVGNGLLTYQYAADKKPVMLVFSTPFAATDYLRVTNSPGQVGQLTIDMLPAAAQSWLSTGLELFALDRCPRCPQFNSMSLDGLAKWTREDFVKVWAHHRAGRSVCGETRILSALGHISAGSHTAARTDLEYVRDHFDCGVPYLHQLIGLLAGLEQDEPAEAIAAERLKEFGPPFDVPLTFSPELLASATVGAMVNFGMHLPGVEPK